MNNLLLDFKNNLELQINNFQLLLQEKIDKLNNKETILLELEKEVNNKQNEIDGYNKVSFIKNMDTQLSKKKKLVEVLESPYSI